MSAHDDNGFDGSSSDPMQAYQTGQSPTTARAGSSLVDFDALTQRRRKASTKQLMNGALLFGFIGLFLASAALWGLNLMMLTGDQISILQTIADDLNDGHIDGQTWIVYVMWGMVIISVYLGWNSIHTRDADGHRKMVAYIVMIVIAVGGTWAVHQYVWPGYWKGHVESVLQEQFGKALQQQLLQNSASGVSIQPETIRIPSSPPSTIQPTTTGTTAPPAATDPGGADPSGRIPDSVKQQLKELSQPPKTP